MPGVHKTLFVSAVVATAALGCLILAGSLILPASDAVAIEGCPNPSCGPVQYTPIVKGVSTVDCMWAEMEANSAAQAYVNCSAEGTCSNSFEVTTACVYSAGAWRVEGRVRYRCASCF